MNKDEKFTPVIKKVLFLLCEGPKKGIEILDTVPDSSLELLGKLRELDMIDHYDRLVYITSIGENIIGK